MDEPLASSMLPQGGDPAVHRATARPPPLPIVYVTHDLGEIIRLADTVVLMSEDAWRRSARSTKSWDARTCAASPDATRPAPAARVRREP